MLGGELSGALRNIHSPESGNKKEEVTWKGKSNIYHCLHMPHAQVKQDIGEQTIPKNIEQMWSPLG